MEETMAEWKVCILKAYPDGTHEILDYDREETVKLEVRSFFQSRFIQATKGSAKKQLMMDEAVECFDKAWQDYMDKQRGKIRRLIIK
jgi:hypothetical protein